MTTYISVAMLGTLIWSRFDPQTPAHTARQESSLPKQANPEYLSVNWDSSGGGAFAVIPLNEKGRLPEHMPLFRGHTGPVLDTDWWVEGNCEENDLANL